jgi:hypothetical protein
MAERLRWDDAMTRTLALLTSALLFAAACSTAPPPPVDPVTEPTVVAAVDEAVRQGSVEGEVAAQTGRRVGRVAGVIAAVLGGPETESLDEVVDRYRRTRDAAEATAAVIGAANGAAKGAQRGYELDLEFAALQQIEGLTVIRPFPDEIEARFGSAPTQEMLEQVAAVFAGHEQRAIDIEAPGDEAYEIRTSLLALGLPDVAAYSVDGVDGIVLRVRYAS